jgi:DNA-binding transcriptional MerR regulator
VAPEVLRVWERRFGAVRPERARTGQRIYRAADVERLTLLKRLGDLGHSVERVATLPKEALQALAAGRTAAVPSLGVPSLSAGAGAGMGFAGMGVAAKAEEPPESAPQATSTRGVERSRRTRVLPFESVPFAGGTATKSRQNGPAAVVGSRGGRTEGALGAVRVGVLGKRIVGQISQHDSVPGPIALVELSETLDRFRPRIAAARADVLVIELCALGEDAQGELGHLLGLSGAREVIVLYDFAAKPLLVALSASRARLLKQPVSVEEVWQAVLAVAECWAAQLAPAAQAGGEAGTGSDAPKSSAKLEIPQRVFDDCQLGRIAEISTTIECECPNHLARIISSLVGFEGYSLTCESESSADEEMHAQLRLEIARARAIVEAALTRVLDHDGIVI